MVEVHSSLVMGVVHSWMQSRNVHHCRALSTLEWVGCTADAAVLERVELRCTQRGNVHPCRTADTWYAASAAVLVPDAVVSFDGALRSGTAVERAGSPSWPTGWTAVGVVLAAVVAAVDIAAAAAAVQVTVAAGVAAVDIAAAAAAVQVTVAAGVAAVDIAAAAAAVQVTVAAGVAAMQAAGVAAMQVSVAAAMGVTAAAATGVTAAAARGLTAAAAMWLTAAAAAVVHRDHRLGACPSACLSACLVHGYHLQSPLRRCLYRQRLAHVGKRPS